jgi:hypothetical protein
MKRGIVGVLAMCTVLVLTAGSAGAGPILGNLWAVSEAVANAATPANVPLTPADVTFYVNAPLNFDSRVLGSGYTVNDWLTGGGAFTIVGSAAALGRSLDVSGTGTLVEFSGMVTVTNGMTFTVAHDDGLTLVINGITVVNNPGPTAPITTTGTYTGASGTFPFQLVYGECCGAPAVLKVDLPLQPVPDAGTTLMLLGGALIGVGALRRKFRI